MTITSTITSTSTNAKGSVMFAQTLLVCVALVAAEPETGAAVMPMAVPQRADGEWQEIAQRVYRAAQGLARHLLEKVHPWSADRSLLLMTESRSGEHWIRPNTGMVESLAFVYRFGPYDAKAVGVSREELLRGKILPMMRYLVATHVTGSRPTSDGKPWGDAWQSAYWAQMLGRGAWWIWPELPQDVRQGVRRVVAHEADRIAASQPPHQIQLDTKAEENAWNSRILSVAMLVMPDDPRRRAWEKAFQLWVLSSYLRPADEHNQAVVDGRTVAEQFTGGNIYDDFTLENHGFVHPDYMTCFGLSLDCALDYAMSGRKAPEALWHNVAGIYENLKWFLLSDGGFVYPSGQDWELFRSPSFVNEHCLAAVFARDPEAWTPTLDCLATLEKMQARSRSGAVYAADEFFFASTETDLLDSLAHMWLMLQYPAPKPKPLERRGVRRLDAGKIVLCRTPTMIHTLSWGTRVMAQCVLNRQDRLTSPDPESGIGHVLVKGERQSLPVSLRDASVTSNATSFEARLVVDHGDRIRGELRFCSADGVWKMSEKLTALADVTTEEIATGLIGILNNPHWIYEKGRRTLAFGGQETAIPALSGRTVDADAASELVVDGVFKITSREPMHARYVGAAKPERARATDRLYLNFVGGERTWKTGEAISRYEVEVRYTLMNVNNQKR